MDIKELSKEEITKLGYKQLNEYIKKYKKVTIHHIEVDDKGYVHLFEIGRY